MNAFYPLVVLAPAVGLATYSISQIVIARWRPECSPYRSLRVGFICGLVVVAIIAGWGAHRMAIGINDRVSFLILDALTYLALAFCYFNFVNLTVASLRIRLLEGLREAGGSAPTGEILAGYNSRQVVATRLERLLAAGHLVEKKGRLYSGRWPFLFVARVFDGLRWFILGRTRC